VICREEFAFFLKGNLTFPAAKAILLKENVICHEEFAFFLREISLSPRQKPFSSRKT
jgi:hypothetical protein